MRRKAGWIDKPPFYPLSHGNNDDYDFRFAIADIGQRRLPQTLFAVLRIEAGGDRVTPVAYAGSQAALSSIRYYTAIQRLVSRQDAICRKLFERAITTVFAQGTSQFWRFDKCI